MKFNYQARTEEGELQVGVIEAGSKESVLSILERGGLYITYLEEAERKPLYAKEIKIFRRVSRKEIVVFTRQLSILFKSAVPLVESLKTIGRQSANPLFREIISKITEDVNSGNSLSSALLSYPRQFSPFFVGMVKSGEAGGKLSESLLYLADHLEREHNLLVKVMGAFIYPVFILFLFFIMGIVMSIYILPGLVEIMEGYGGELPFMTKMTLSLFGIFAGYWWLFVILVIFLIVALPFFSRTKMGKKFFDRFLLKVPLIKDLAKKIYLSRFAENLATLISGGLPIARALEVTADVAGNEIYKNIILTTRDRVRKGETISSVLEKYPEYVSPLFLQMVLVGERSGQLANTLLNVVEFYQQEVERATDSFIKLLEPILILFLGLLVGGVVISVFVPLYELIGGMGAR